MYGKNLVLCRRDEVAVASLGQSHSTFLLDDGVIATTWITEGDGTGSFSFNGKDYTTNKVKRRILTGASGGVPNDTVVYHDAFSPDLGVQVSSDQDSHYVLGALQAGEHWQLVGYKQK